jgi:hypothetical protein
VFPDDGVWMMAFVVAQLKSGTNIDELFADHVTLPTVIYLAAVQVSISLSCDRWLLQQEH